MIRLPMIPVFAISRESEETWLGKLRGEQITYRTTFVLGFGIAGAVLFLGVLCAVLDIHLVHVAPILGMCALLSIGALTAHRLGLRIARDLATAFAILLFGMFLHPAIEHLSLRFGYSLVSTPLARADAAMGLNWLAYHNWVRSMAALREATLVTYNSFGIQMLLVPCLLAAVGATSRMLRFFAASAITLLAVDVIFMIWPADNAATFFRAGDPVPLSWSHDLVSYIVARTTSYDVTDNLVGLVSFPSFHTAGAVIGAWALRRTVLFWPVMILESLLLLGVPAWGGHYFVDILAGLIVAVIAIVLVEYQVVRKPSRLSA